MSPRQPIEPAKSEGDVGRPERQFIAFAVDGAGRVVRWSDGAVRALGRTASEVIGYPPPVPPPWPQTGDWSRPPAHGAELLDETVVWEDAGGRPHELAVSVTAGFGADGESAGLMVVARDISARRRLEEQLVAYARDLRETYGQEVARRQELESSYAATVQALAVAVEAKDETTGGHIRRVGELGMLLARAHLGTAAEDPQLGYAFLLHDIGKLAVPDAVLNKPAALDEVEWELMRRHPEAGARILSGVPFLGDAVEIVRAHHERWDGKGYPAGLRGDEIPAGARIFAIVDTIDAMTSDRPYRRALPLEVALQEVTRQSGRQFDPACVASLLSIDRRSIEALLEPHPEV